MEHKAQKQYGQNFLINEGVCKTIVMYLPKDAKNVLEIGPGKGALTKYLLKKYEAISAVEIDRDLAANLANEFPQIKLSIENVKKHDISNYDLIVGNIPYNITTELLLKCLREGTTLKTVVFMVQAEAFQRIIVAKEKSERTPISTIINMYFNRVLLLNVPRSDFNPMPHVDSVVFQLSKKENCTSIPVKDIYAFLLILYSSRRKNIVNNLIKKYNKDKVKEAIEKLSISGNLRAEDLTDLQIVSLYETLLIK